jgi:AraC-like DNA-binding protein
MMRYWEQTPTTRLVKHIECFWFVSEQEGSATTGATERVLPDGCLEWIFHLGLPFERATVSGEWEVQPQSFIVGQLTRFLLLKPTGRVEIMGVRFKPGGAYRFLRCPLESLTDNNAPPSDLWGGEGKYLEEAVLEACDNTRRQQLVEEFLLKKLEQTTPRLRLEATIAEIIRSRGQTRVHELAEQIGLSSRQLEREFRTSVGLSPKGLARILRFQNLLRLVGEGPLREWAYLACESGYADQAHMVREFREFSGQSPSEPQSAGELASYFISPRRLAILLGPSPS